MKGLLVGTYTTLLAIRDSTDPLYVQPEFGTAGGSMERSPAFSNEGVAADCLFRTGQRYAASSSLIDALCNALEGATFGMAT